MNTDKSVQPIQGQDIPVTTTQKETYFFPNDGEHTFSVDAKTLDDAEKANQKYLDDLKKEAK
jgi:hypothetical protein